MDMNASRWYNPIAVQTVLVLVTLLMASVVSHIVISLGEIVFGGRSRHEEFLEWSARFIAPIQITLRFGLYTFFIKLIITPLMNTQYASTRTAKTLVKRCKQIMVFFTAGFIGSAILLVESKEWETVSACIGFLSLLVALLYTFIAYRCYGTLTKMSHQTTAGTTSYERIASFTLSLNAIYATGHVCQSVMYLSSVLYPRLYVRHLDAFQLAFKYSDLFTMLASVLYLHWSVKTIKRRDDINNAHMKNKRNPINKDGSVDADHGLVFNVDMKPSEQSDDIRAVAQIN